MKSLLKRLKISLKIYFGESSLFYNLLSISTPGIDKRMVTKDTDICLEGFPRSGNTFLFHSFKFYNPDTKIAHHVHAEIQFIRAIKFGVPCVIVIREPLETLASLMVVDGILNLNLAFQYYISYYQRLIRYCDQVVIIDNDDIENGVIGKLERINKANNKTFKYEGLTAEALKAVTANMRESNRGGRYRMLIPLPDKEKSTLKEKINQDIKSHQRFEEAMNLYRKVKSHV